MAATLTFDILARDKASKTIAGVGTTAEKTSKKFNVLKTAAIGAGIAAAGLAVKFGKDSIKAFAEAEEAQKRLQDAFERFPNIADTNIGRLRDLNTALQKKTKFDDDALASGQAVLAQFKVTGKQLEELTPLVADYASRTGKDIPRAAQDVGKALLGNAKALKNIGIKYQATGNAALDTSNIIGILRKQVGGFAEKEGQTAAGKAAILKNQFGELQETVGSKLVPALSKLAEFALGVLDKFNKLDPVTKKIVVGVTALGLAALVAGPRVAALSAAVSSLGLAVKTAGVSFAAFLIAMPALIRIQAEATDSSKSWMDRLKGVNKQIIDTVDPTDKLSGALGLNADKAKNAGTATDALKETAKVYGDTLSTLTTPAVTDLATATQSAYDKQNLLNGVMIDATTANIGFRDAVVAWTLKVRDGVKANGDSARSLSLNTQAGRDNVGALIDMAKKASDHASAVYDQTKNLGKANTVLKTDRQRLLDAGTAAGFNKDELQKLIDKYLKVPTKAQTKITTPGMAAAHAKAEGLKTKMEQLEARAWKVTVEMRMKNKLRLEAIAAAHGMVLNVTGKPMMLAGGGAIRGPGTGTSDSVPAMVSNGEYVIKASRARQLGTRFLNMLNGAKSVGGDPGAVVLRYAAGGSVSAVQSFIRAQKGERYLLGGAGPNVWDCSGITGAAYAILKGLAYGMGQRYFTTQSNFGALGFQRGTGAYTIGVSPAAGHMVGNIGGLSFEAARPGVPLRVGNATSVQSMAQQWFLNAFDAFTNADRRTVMRNLGIKWGMPGAGRSMTSYEAGTPYVPRTGMYRLHRGEAVIPAGQNGPVELSPKTIRALGEVMGRVVLSGLGAANVRSARNADLYARAG
jgi:hypothetical protein